MYQISKEIITICTTIIVPLSLYHYHCTIIIVPLSLYHYHCTITTVKLLIPWLLLLKKVKTYDSFSKFSCIKSPSPEILMTDDPSTNHAYMWGPEKFHTKRRQGHNSKKHAQDAAESDLGIIMQHPWVDCWFLTTVKATILMAIIDCRIRIIRESWM